MEITALQFEEMIDRLEKGCGQQVCHHKADISGLYYSFINLYTFVLPVCWKNKQSSSFFIVKGSIPFFVPQLVSLQEAKLLLKEDDELIKEVFDYWSRKRKICKSSLLIPVVKQEKRDGSSTSDPYVAFRRRTEKMQTRKVCAVLENFGLLLNSVWLSDLPLCTFRTERMMRCRMRRCWNYAETWAELSPSWRWSRGGRRARGSCSILH